MALALIALAESAFAQEPAEQAKDHTLVYGIGWNGDWSRSEGVHAAGASFGVEVTPIEDWLSIETTVSAMRANHQTDVPIEVAFRKPWQLSPKVELMAGVAPEVVHRFGTNGETFGGVSFGGHVMVWPRRNLGWFAESAYEVEFPRDGTERGMSFSAGLLIGH